VIDYESRCALYEHHKFSSIRAAIREDIVRFATFSPAYRPEISFKTSVSIFLQPAILCLFCYRIGHYLYVRRWMRLAHAVSRFNLIVHKANIPPQSCIGPGCFLGHCPGIVFHGTAGRNLTMLSLAVCCPKEDSFGGPAVQGSRLGDGVTLGGSSVVIGPVTIGDNAKVAPLTWLAVDCPRDAIAFSARLRHSLRPSGGPHFG
jgi:serine O-acetyltransferase